MRGKTLKETKKKKLIADLMVMDEEDRLPKNTNLAEQRNIWKYLSISISGTFGGLYCTTVMQSASWKYLSISISGTFGGLYCTTVMQSASWRISTNFAIPCVAILWTSFAFNAHVNFLVNSHERCNAEAWSSG